MRLLCRKKGFSLVETLAVISVIAILAAMVLGVGKHVKDQANIKLTKSTIDILVTAVELYYQDEGRMPFGTGAVGSMYLSSNFEGVLGGPITFNTTNDHTDLVAYGDADGNTDDWSSEALYYCLAKSLNSRRIVNTINNSQVSSLDKAGVPLNIDVDAGVVEDNIDLPRFVDAWGNTLRYNYVSGSTFCVISSPGKDKEYGTADDINNLN